MTAVENKIPNVSNLVTKTDYNTKINEIEKKITNHNHDKYITTSEFNNLAANLLVENELKKLQKFDSRYFRGRNRFEEDGVQNYLVFQPMYKYLLKIGSTESIAEWESKGLSNEVFKPLDNSLAPEVKFTGKRMYVKFSRSCLKQDIQSWKKQ